MNRMIFALCQLRQFNQLLFYNNLEKKYLEILHVYSVFRLGPVCRTNGLLELWSFNEAVINQLTKDDILREINKPNLIRCSITFL